MTGQATVDADYFNEALTRPGGWKRTRAVVMHELGPGDRRGLALLGKGPCG